MPLLIMLKDVFYNLYKEYGTRALIRRKRSASDMSIDYMDNTQSETTDEITEAYVLMVFLPTNYAMLEKVVPQLRGDLKVGDKQFLIQTRDGAVIGDQFSIKGKKYDIISILSADNTVYYGIARNIQDEQ